MNCDKNCIGSPVNCNIGRIKGSSSPFRQECSITGKLLNFLVYLVNYIDIALRIKIYSKWSMKLSVAYTKLGNKVMVLRKLLYVIIFIVTYVNGSCIIYSNPGWIVEFSIPGTWTAPFCYKRVLFLRLN